MSIRVEGHCRRHACWLLKYVPVNLKDIETTHLKASILLEKEAFCKAYQVCSRKFLMQVFSKENCLALLMHNKQVLGGNVRIILSRAAPLAPHVEAFLKVVTCSHVLQGYGLIETCAESFVLLPNEMDMLSTVDPPVPNLYARLESVPEMNYDAPSSKPQG